MIENLTINTTAASEKETLLKIADFLLEQGVAKYDTIEAANKNTRKQVKSVKEPVNRAHLVVKDKSSSILKGVIEEVDATLSRALLDEHEKTRLLLKNQELRNIGENELILLHRFVRQREEFFTKHSFADATRFMELTGDQDTNISRKMKALRENDEVIYVQQGTTLLYPEFQLNNQGVMYEDLLSALPKLHKASRSNWDICFWLFTEQSIVIKRGKVDPKKLSGMSFEEMAKAGEKASKHSTYFTGTPMEALISGDFSTFNMLVENWIAPDERLVETEDVAIG